MAMVLDVEVCVISKISGHLEWASMAKKYILFKNGPAKSMCTLCRATTRVAMVLTVGLAWLIDMLGTTLPVVLCHCRDQATRGGILLGLSSGKSQDGHDVALPGSWVGPL